MGKGNKTWLDNHIIVIMSIKLMALLPAGKGGGRGEGSLAPMHGLKFMLAICGRIGL
jgi:hypothetical protein